MSEKCLRCNGSGEIGVRTNGAREAAGPVPEDARGWTARECLNCQGTGEIAGNDDQEDQTEVAA